MKMRMKALPSFETLVDTFEYDVLKGVLVWRKPSGTNTQTLGKIAGWINQFGYRIVRLKSINWRHARLVHMFLHGEDPGTKCVDHINRDRADDRAWNLRLATFIQNSANRDNRNYRTDFCHGTDYYRQGSRWAKRPDNEDS